MYKIEVPVPNDILNDRALSAYIEAIDKHKDSIDCLYLPLGYVDTDIQVWGIRAPIFVMDKAGNPIIENVHRWEWCINEILKYVDLPIKILMNNLYSRSFHVPEHIAKIQKKLHYYSDNYIVKSITIADYSAMPLIQQLGLPISLSTNSHNSFAELDMAFEIYGQEAFDSIVIQRDLNRNPSKLNSYLKKRNLFNNAVLMVNEGCINACPYKTSGDIEIGVSDLVTKQNVIHSGGCTLLQKDLKWTFLTSPFLTKDMIDTYYPNIGLVKIAGRDLPVSNIKHQLNHWVTGEVLPLEKILNVFPKDTGLTTASLDQRYLDEVMSCNKECYVCKKCELSYSRFTGIPTMAVSDVEGFKVMDSSAILKITEQLKSKGELL